MGWYTPKNKATNDRIVESKVKCKCGSSDLFLIEVWDASTIDWEQIDGKFNRDDGNLHEGSPEKVQARCKNCGKMWTVRGANQITDVVKEY